MVYQANCEANVSPQRLHVLVARGGGSIRPTLPTLLDDNTRGASYTAVNINRGMARKGNIRSNHAVRHPIGWTISG
jgi:hypothetical protein